MKTDECIAEVIGIIEDVNSCFSTLMYRKSVAMLKIEHIELLIPNLIKESKW